MLCSLIVSPPASFGCRIFHYFSPHSFCEQQTERKVSNRRCAISSAWVWRSAYLFRAASSWFGRHEKGATGGGGGGGGCHGCREDRELVGVGVAGVGERMYRRGVGLCLDGCVQYLPPRKSDRRCARYYYHIESFGRLGLIICVTSSHEPISCPLFYTSRSANISLPNMSYKAGIVKAISELKERNGSSSIAIKKHMQVRGQYLLVNTTPLVLFVVANLIPRLCRCRFDLLEQRQTCPQTRSG